MKSVCFLSHCRVVVDYLRNVSPLSLDESHRPTVHTLAAYDSTKTSLPTGIPPAECTPNTLPATCKITIRISFSFIRWSIAETDCLDARETAHTWNESKPFSSLRPPILLQQCGGDS